jgi:CRISPR-associated protein Csd1
VLEPDGRLMEIADGRMPDPKDKKGSRKVARPLIVLGGAKPTGSGINPCLLWDNTAYMLGYKPYDPKPARTGQAFAAFRQRHLDLEREVNDLEFSAVCRFLSSWDPEQAKNHPELEELGTGFGVFRIRGQTHFVHDRPAVQRYWRGQIGQREEAAGETGQCLATGLHSRLARIHEPKIKGVLDAQSSGATLVSFNFNATESYGKEQSYNAPVGEEAAFRYANALNHLLRAGSRQRVQIGDATTVFWTAQPSPAEAVFGMVFQAPPEDEKQKKEVEALLRQVARGAKVEDLGDPDIPFYVLGLSANAARLSVRFWHVSSVGDMVAKLKQHYSDLHLEGAAPWEPEFPSVQNLLDQTARERKDIPPLLGGALMRAILNNTLYPEAFYLAVLRRIRADRQINHVRAASIKACLKRVFRKEVPVAYDPNRQESAYHLGALFAALEKVQEDAFTNEAGRVTINGTIRDRYFGAASATPRSVFPRLIRLKQHHLGKLENPGHRITHEKRIQDIVCKVQDFPPHLSLQDQGLFAIGYYHQRKAFFTKKDQTDGHNPSTERED